MTDEEKNEMFSKVFKQFSKSHKGCYHFSDHIYARDLFDIILEEIEEYAKAIAEENEELKVKYAELKKNALEWHKVKCFDKPDENGYITNDCPGDIGKEFLVRGKLGDFSVRELIEIDNGVLFEDCEWEDVDAWAELREGM